MLTYNSTKTADSFIQHIYVYTITAVQSVKSV
jgi:hypothetical protein